MRLDSAALAGVLAHYPQVGELQGVCWHSTRPFAASGILACARGPVFVKRHDARVRSVADLREEHEFIAHLRAQGCAVPQVLGTREGSTAVAGPDGTYELHGIATGNDRYRNAPSWTPISSLAEARQAGGALARLHGAAAGFNAPVRHTRLVVAGDWLKRAACPAAALEAWVAQDAALRGALTGRPWQADFARVLLPLYGLTPTTPAPLWAHGDFHASNLLWGDGGVSDVLDFGLSNRASAVFDLATAIERNAIAWLEMGMREIGHADIACALIDGYARIAPVPEGVAAALPIVHVEFALTELSYFHAITGDASHAEMAYTDFLLGHAIWFRGAAGAHFLAQLV